MRIDSPLTMNEIRSLVSELNSERARLERSLAMLEDDNRGGGTSVQLQTAARRDALMAALDRVRQGAYGVCERCGQGIPFGRLLVMPEVTYCVACQTRP